MKNNIGIEFIEKTKYRHLSESDQTKGVEQPPLEQPYTGEGKHIDLPEEMKRAIARQAEAERERRAKIIHAEGELQASEKLSEAANKLGKEPTAIQLRFLQTLVEVAAENNSTMLFPVPIDLFEPFLKKISGTGGKK